MEDAFVGGEGCVKLFELADLGLEGAVGGADGVVLGLQGCYSGEVLMDFLLCLLGEGGREGMEKVFLFWIWWNGRGWYWRA